MLSILIVIGLIVTIQLEGIKSQVDYIMIHSLIMSLVSYVRLHRLCQLYGVFNRTWPLILYFILFAAALGFLMEKDFTLNNS